MQNSDENCISKLKKISFEICASKRLKNFDTCACKYSKINGLKIVLSNSKRNTLKLVGVKDSKKNLSKLVQS